jgi:HAD superfamily hydrolase (TIGR01509 family)
VKLEIPHGEFKAYLFDCDGTLADSMPLHYDSWRKVLAQFQCEFPESLFYQWGGISGVKIVEMLNERFSLSMDPELVVREKEISYLEQLHHVQPISEVVEHVKQQHRKIPFAVVSGSPNASVRKTLKILGLENYFECIVGCDDCIQTKPHPEPYLAAARILGVSPEHCLVFEDADLGIESARAAGMRWVKVRGS